VEKIICNQSSYILFASCFIGVRRDGKNGVLDGWGQPVVVEPFGDRCQCAFEACQVAFICEYDCQRVNERVCEAEQKRCQIDLVRYELSVFEMLEIPDDRPWKPGMQKRISKVLAD
jgi:hypothetical protein